MIPLSTTSDQCWRTPRYVYDYADARWGKHVIDMCADSQNVSMCASYVGAEGRTIYTPPPLYRWESNWWCNPPWRATRQWVARAIEALKIQAAGTLLVRADLATAWAAALHEVGLIVVLSPRVAYHATNKRTTAPPCGSMLIRLDPSGRAGDIELLRLEDSNG
jgi:phage N-6-adenine-methyltransferase